MGELRELGRYLAQAGAATLSGQGQCARGAGQVRGDPRVADVCGPVGSDCSTTWNWAYASRLASQRRILSALSAEITLVEVAARSKDNRASRDLLRIEGIGRVMAVIFSVEIGDTRFTNAAQPAS
jgi:transposase